MSLPDDLARAEAALVSAELAEHPHERFLAAHVAALRVAACVLSVRARGVRIAGGRRPGRTADGGALGNAWELLAAVAPEFGEWAAFFAATQLKRQAVQAGAIALVSAREADDLVRDAAAFHDEAARRLGVRRDARRGAG